MDPHLLDVRCISLGLFVTKRNALWTRRGDVPAIAKPTNIVKKAKHQVNH